MTARLGRYDDMNVIQRLAAKYLQATTEKSEWNDFWYQPITGGPTIAGIEVNEFSAENCLTLAAAVRLVSSTIASLPLVLYRRVPSLPGVNKPGKERAYDHPLARVINEMANPMMTAFEFWQMMVAHLLYRGNSYALQELDSRGNVVALWPMHPARMTIYVSPEKELKYLYRDLDGIERGYDEWQVFHIRGLSSDGIVGKSPITQHRESIGLTLAAETYGASFFGNGARAAYVITAQGKFKDDAAATEFRRRWEEAHRGPANQNRVAILENGMDVKNIGLSPDDSQFLETRRFQVAEMARIICYIPPHLLGDTERSTSWGTGIESQNIGFNQFGLLPIEILIEQRIKESLLGVVEKKTLYAKFCVEGLLRGDSKARAAFYTTMRNLSAFNANDILELEDRNPRMGGDDYWEPANMRVIGPDGEPKYVPQPAAPSQQGDQDDDTEDDQSPSEEQNQDNKAAFRPLLEQTFARIYRRGKQDWPAAAKKGQQEEWVANYGAYMKEQLDPVFSVLGIDRCEVPDPDDPSSWNIDELAREATSRCLGE
jgi:HK97 family phage portal protein